MTTSEFLRRARRGALLLALLLLAAAGPVQAARELRGFTPGGAAYVIAVPDGWEPGDTLVFINHGFNLARVLDPSLGPLAELQLAEGYALAASGYRQRGWALFKALDDNAELLEVFRDEVGEPGPIIVAGASMGGLITLKQAEDPRFPNVVGAYPLCPAAAGARTWDGALDVRLKYDVVCDGVGGGELPTGAEPTPWAYDLDDLPDDIDDPLTDSDVLTALARVTQCTGLALPENLRTPPQRARLARLKALTQVTDEEFLGGVLAYATFALGDLVRAPDKLAGGNPFDTRGVVYGDAEVDAAVPRFAPDPIAQFELVRSSTVTGRTTAKILALHTSGDQLLPIEQLQSLAGRVPFDQMQLLQVDETAPTHCGFSGPELAAGWEALRDWIDDGDKPAASKVQATCRTLVAGGAEGECRIAQYACCLPPLDAKLAPRPAYVAAAGGTSYSYGSVSVPGLWYAPERSGEGLFVEPLGDGRVLVTWYTFPRTGEPGDQLWLFGEGRVVGNGFTTDTLLRLDGGGFAGAFDPDDVTRTPWGSLTLVLDGADQATLRYTGPEGYGSGTRVLTRLSGQHPQTVFSPPPPPIFGHTGAFYDPARPGEGIFVHLDTTRTDPPQPRALYALWYTFDEAGRPRWYFATPSLVEVDPPLPAGSYLLSLLRPHGTRFGDAFDPDAVQRPHAGAVLLTFANGGTQCTRVTLDYALDGGGSGRLEYVRLSRPFGSSCPP